MLSAGQRRSVDPQRRGRVTGAEVDCRARFAPRQGHVPAAHPCHSISYALHAVTLQGFRAHVDGLQCTHPAYGTQLHLAPRSPATHSPGCFLPAGGDDDARLRYALLIQPSFRRRTAGGDDDAQWPRAGRPGLAAGAGGAVAIARQLLCAIWRKCVARQLAAHVRDAHLLHSRGCPHYACSLSPAQQLAMRRPACQR